MKKIKRGIIFSLIVCVIGMVLSTRFVADENSYYVCFSNQNYSIKNANKMELQEDGTYKLENIKLTSTINFYITDNTGVRYYANDNSYFHTDEIMNLSYNILFSKDSLYDNGAHATYEFYNPKSISILINDVTYPLTYNPYVTNYEEYYLSEIKLISGDQVVVDEETYIIKNDGYYRILYTPGEDNDGDTYLYDSEGVYGTGEDNKYHLYIEDAVVYYIAFKDLELENNDEVINGLKAYHLTKNESKTTVDTYESRDFFIKSKDFSLKYYIYQYNNNGTYKLIDDDDDEDTIYSKLVISDVGWYKLEFKNYNTYYTSSMVMVEKDFGFVYLAASFNNYGYDEQGVIDLNDDYIFEDIEDNDDENYNEDYAQKILYFTVTAKDLKNGPVSFVITDGKTIYKNGSDDIELNVVGTYKILFSYDHDYGRNHHYRYILEDEEKNYEDLYISSVEEYLAFASACNQNADYSLRLNVYLTCDLDFKKETFVQIKMFAGHFYGGFHVIKNINYQDDNNSSSIIKTIARSGIVENVIFQNITLGSKNDEYVGIIGQNFGIIRRLSVTGTFIGQSYVGSICGYNGKSVIDSSSSTIDSSSLLQLGTIENSTSYGNVNGEIHVGGIVGFNVGKLDNIIFSGTVQGSKFSSSSRVLNIGGISGYNAGIINEGINNGIIDAVIVGTYVGGISGMTTGEIYFSFNYGDVFGKSYVGGITGYYGRLTDDDSSFSNYYSGITLSDFLDYYFPTDEEKTETADGNNHALIYCLNEGNIKATSYAGGISGYINSSVVTIYADINNGDVEVTAGSYVGGIIGYTSNASISDVASSGNISATGLNAGKYVGGIAGYARNIYYSASSSVISGTAYLGGIAGYLENEGYGNYFVGTIVTTDGLYQGSIFGDTASYNISMNTFDNKCKANYYTFNYGGINGVEYGINYNDAAKYLQKEEFATKNSLCEQLNIYFSDNHFLAGASEATYPVLSYFEESNYLDAYDDEDKFNKIFLTYQNTYQDAMNEISLVYIKVVFMEYNADNGDLYDDDGNINYDNFEIIKVYKVAANEIINNKDYMYAKDANGILIYETSSATYYVSCPEIVASEDCVVYFEYEEMVSSISSANKEVFVNGLFFADDTCLLVELGDYYEIKLNSKNNNISLSDNLVKLYIGENSADYNVYLIEGNNKKLIDSFVSGNYICFNYSTGQLISLEQVPSVGISGVVYLIIGAIVGAIIVISIWAIASRKKRKLQ